MLFLSGCLLLTAVAEARNCKARELSGPTTVRREGDELDYEFRNTPASGIQEIVAAGDDKPLDARVRDATRAIKSLEEDNEGPVPKLP